MLYLSYPHPLTKKKIIVLATALRFLLDTRLVTIISMLALKGLLMTQVTAVPLPRDLALRLVAFFCRFLPVKCGKTPAVTAHNKYHCTFTFDTKKEKSDDGDGGGGGGHRC